MTANLDIPGLGLPTQGADGILRWGTGDSIPLPHTVPSAREQTQARPEPFPRWAVWIVGAGLGVSLLSLVLASVALGVAIARG